MKDAILISRLLDGDPETVAMVRAWIRAAFGPYRRHLASDLEDLEQDILLELNGALLEGRFEGRSRLRTYVHTYSHHKCIDRLRALVRRKYVDVDGLELESRAPSAFERLSMSESTELALRVVEEMPESCRDLWRMLQEGLSYGEMSRRLKIAEGTLRVRVLRCRKRALELRNQLMTQRRDQGRRS